MRFINWYGYIVYENGTILNKDGTKKKAKKNRKGYLFSNFYLDGELKTKTFHKVVTEAFLGECPVGYEVDHIDNDRSNNAISNLQYLTKSQNNKKAYDSGNRSFVFGDSNPNSLYRKGIRNGIKRI